MKITGATRLFAIIGDPIAQVKSPEVHTARFAAAGLDAVMVPMHVPADGFDDIVPALKGIANVDGIIVTVPFKTRILAHLDNLGASAQAVGAVNAMRRESDGSWSGDIFDGIGFVRGAQQRGHRLQGRRVTLFGAGGAGSAVACALADAGVAAIDVIDAIPAKAGALADRLAKHFPACASREAESVHADRDMIVNASPVGMHAHDGLPGDIAQLAPDVLVGDVVIVSSPTALIRMARAAGCPCVEGRDMLEGQVEALLAFFRVPAGGANAAAAHGPPPSP